MKGNKNNVVMYCDSSASLTELAYNHTSIIHILAHVRDHIDSVLAWLFAE